MFQDAPFLIMVAAIFFIGNYAVYKFIVFTAIKKFIKPYLISKNLTFVRVEFAGLFNFGDFPKRQLRLGFNSFGNIVNETFVFVYAKTPERNVIRFTAKIKTVFLMVKDVAYKGLQSA